MKHLFGIRALAACAVMGAAAAIAGATSVQMASGLSAEGEPVVVQAELTITGDLLTVKLSNLSTFTTSPSGLLCSYYFDIVNGAMERPELTLVSAVGDVWQPLKNDPDVLVEAGADLKAEQKFDGTWLFKDFQAAGGVFGVGTVGNSSLANLNFNGSIVGDMAYGLYAGDLTVQSLSNRLLVKDSIFFTFSGATGFTEDDISPLGIFGFGTAPDTLLATTTVEEIPPASEIPEPMTMAMFGLGVAGYGSYAVRRVRARG